MGGVVLAYSGGLDTSVILRWLVKEGHDCHAVYVDVGQPNEDLAPIREKALACGASSFRSVDKKAALCRDFGFPMVQWQARYEGLYLMGTSIARPVITVACLEVAREVKADAFAHGATGKGNDQCRFELTARALAPDVSIIAPWRDAKFRKAFPGRKEMIAWCAKNGVPVTATKAKPYSSDANCLHISYESGVLEDLTVEGFPIIDFAMVTPPEQAPDKSEVVAIGFKDGLPTTVNGKKLGPFPLVHRLNQIAGRHGVGLLDMVENRFVGMKSRGVYEAPGMTVLMAAHRCLEQLTVDRDLLHLRDRLMPEVAELVYNGFWFSRKMDGLMAFIREAQRKVTGEVTMRLYKGNVAPVSRHSPESLYDEAVATMEGGGPFNQTDSAGFLRIQGLPLAVQARQKWWTLGK